MKKILEKELRNEFPELTEKALELYNKNKPYCPPFALAWACTELKSWEKVQEAIQLSKDENIPFCTAVRLIKSE